ncbi:MAG TPA: bifunctional sulfate adenylyltransferase/adenylylsulfate kinase [Thermoanaerobaculia bacterium]|nr:bifunctional sulfate adenylyltransferase/adenylylsulfate kinase [Thermoanaerobaculia bacterium]
MTRSLRDDPEPAERSPVASESRRAELRAELPGLPSWELTPRQLCDLELLAVGAYAPLDSFMGRAEVEEVCRSMRLPGGALFPLPVTLDVTEETAAVLAPGAWLTLRDPEGLPLAVVAITELWAHDREAEAEAVYGTLDPAHPGVDHLLHRTHNVAVAGRIEVLRLPPHFDFVELRRTPAELRAEFERRGWSRVIAFQTRNPMHRAHFELTRRAAEQVGGGLLLHPAVGPTRPGDVDHFTRVRCYQRLLARYPPDSVRLALLPLAMRMAGPREALLHALIRRNYGCSHFIVGRDHAGPGSDRDGKPFYGPYEAQELVRRHEAELGIEMVPFRELVYLPDENRYLDTDELAGRGEPAPRTLTLGGSELRRRLDEGAEIPEWFTFPEVAEELRRRHPPRARRGFTVFFTGLSGAGKSTIARALELRLLERGGRPVTLLDGDIVRKNLSSELGFSKEHRDLNIRRIGFVAAEITKNGGVAICAPIAPYDAVRREVRREIEPLGGFVECWVSTPLAVCEERDVKGLYAQARAGRLEAFTGISDPYEEPEDAELELDASRLTPEQAVDEIVRFLERSGFLPAAS